MRLDSRLFDSVRTRKPRRNGNAEDLPHRCCEWPDCSRPAAHKAPLAHKEAEKARAAGKPQHHFFCLDHVRIYNRSYNYFAGMNHQEIDAFRKASLTGLRPTWVMGRQGAGPRHVPGEWLRRRVQDLLRRWQQDGRTAATASAPRRKMSRNPGNLLPADREALKTLGFVANGKIPAGGEIKARYKSLVKRFHPDAQGDAATGSVARGDRLIRILRAHDHLKARAFF